MKFTLFEELSGLPLVTVVTLMLAAAMVAALVVLLLRARKSAAPRENRSGVQALVYGALAVALSFLLSYFKLFEMPQGGSITLCSILPVAVYAYWFGLRKGLVAGLAFGLLQFFQEPIAIHWMSPVLDYVLAFTCIGFAGLFPKSLPLGILAGGIGRVICSTVSGAVFFYMYAPEGMNPWVYSFIYNAISLGPDAIICAVLALVPTVRRTISRMAPRDGHRGEAAGAVRGG